MGLIKQETFHLQQVSFPPLATLQTYFNHRAGLNFEYRDTSDLKMPYLMFEILHPSLGELSLYYHKNEICFRRGGSIDGFGYLYYIILTSMIDFVVEQYPNQCLLFSRNWNCLILNQENKDIAYNQVVSPIKYANWMSKSYNEAKKYKKIMI